MYISESWTLDDPWGRNFTCVSPQTPQADIPTFGSLRSFQIPRLMHATHQQFAKSIVKDNGFIPSPYLATPGFTFEQKVLIQGEKIAPLQPLQGEVLPGKYVWFSVDVDLTFEQKEACKRIMTLTTDAKGHPKHDFWYKQPIKLADYIEHHSRYGNYTFRIDFVTLLENYRRSRKQPDSEHLPDIYLKFGGTKRYENTATHIIIVCAVNPSQEDPLPKFPNLTREKLRNQHVLNPRGLLDDSGKVQCDSYGNILHGVLPEFRPLGITAGQFDTKTMQWYYHNWDQMDFTFHFPSDSDEKLHCGVFPQKVYHSYCVPLKRNKIEDCEVLQGTTNQAEGVPRHLIDRFH